MGEVFYLLTTDIF